MAKTQRRYLGESRQEAEGEVRRRKTAAGDKRKRRRRGDAEFIEFVLTSGLGRPARNAAQRIEEQLQNAGVLTDTKCEPRPRRTHSGFGSSSDSSRSATVLFPGRDGGIYPRAAPAHDALGERRRDPEHGSDCTRGERKGTVTVSGTDFFRKEAWFAASLAGLKVGATSRPNSNVSGWCARSRAAPRRPRTDLEVRPERSREE